MFTPTNLLLFRLFLERKRVGYIVAIPKIGLPSHDVNIENYKQTIRNLSKYGVVQTERNRFYCEYEPSKGANFCSYDTFFLRNAKRDAE